MEETTGSAGIPVGSQGTTLRNIQEEERMTRSQNESDSGYSVTSGSPHSQEGNLDTEAGPDIAEMEGFNEDEFRPATEVFSGQDLDYLTQHGSATATVSHLARQSLYAKFDPLIGGRPSVLGRPSVAPFAKRMEGEDDLIAMNSPVNNNKPANTTRTNITALDSTLESASETLRSNASSAPLPEEKASSAEHDTTVAPNVTLSHRQEGDDTNATINLQERMARDLEYQQMLVEKEKRLEEVEGTLKKVTKEVETLKRELKVKNESYEQMKQVVSRYEKTISDLLKDNKEDHYRKELDNLQKGKEQVEADVRNLETAFLDYLRKYERTKEVLEDYKQNEEELKRCIEEYKIKLTTSQQSYETLKTHAREKMEEANRKIEDVSKAKDIEIAKLTAMVKKVEMKASSLERGLEEKEKQNKELSSIVDDLIGKFGS